MELAEQEKCEVLNLLGITACSMAGNRFTRPVGAITKDIPLCQACDSEDFKDNSVPQWRCPDFDELWHIFAYILPNITRAPGLRITAMIALRRALVHAPNSSQMQLVSSVFGEFCLHSLRSSMRELRVITGYIPPPLPSSLGFIEKYSSTLTSPQALSDSIHQEKFGSRDSSQ